MTEDERSLEALRAQVATLELENVRLRQAALGEAEAPGREVPRRALLAAGLGLLGAAAGADILAQGQTAFAAGSDDSAAGQSALGPAVIGAQFSQPKLLGMRVALRGQRSSTATFARYEWSLGKQFSDSKPPIVLASVLDSALNVPPGDAPVCSVFVYGSPGAYAAMITVHNLDAAASTVEVNLLAFGG
ncbi:MAG TPA: hypothetical protein VN837_18745 [Chloroflexota bacterium]|nr:hypothetical protein [Chloroflexota bacterium]